MGVADRILAADAFGECRVGEEFRAKLHEPLSERRFGFGERGLRAWRSGIDDGSGRQHKSQVGHGVVGVLGHGAAHAARIVSNHPADRAGVIAGRIWPELAAMTRQHGVGVGQDQARLGAEPQAVGLDLAAVPVATHLDQDVVRLRLAVQAGAGGAECGVASLLPAVGQDLGDLRGGARHDHDLRDHPVRARVRGVANQVDQPVQHAILAQQRHQVVPQLARRAVEEFGRNGVGLLRTFGTADPARIGGKEFAHARGPTFPRVGPPPTAVGSIGCFPLSGG